MLDRLPLGIRRPRYNRQALEAGVVHIGLGAFHRAHQAPVYETLAALGDLRWGVIAGSPRSATVRDALASQDNLYSLTIEDGGARETQVIGILKHVIVAPEAPQQLVDAIASPATKLVTITATEKAYKLDATSGQLMVDDPDVRRDLESLQMPSTMPGFLAAGLQLRRERSLPPITIMSCDNLPSNGRKLARAVSGIASARDQHLADWIVESCTFPSTMVDRIVPAATDADIAGTVSRLHALDLAPVRTEPFSQWVIENRFAGAVPDFERCGAQLTEDVGPWEQAKLRLLNGGHSAMAYLGGLAGIATVHEFVADAWGAIFLERLWDELEPTLSENPQLDVHAYRIALMRRFSNSALRHRLRQIAADGSQKIPQRLLAPAIELLDAGREPVCIALVVAAWMRWQSGRDDTGKRFAVDDPLASTTFRLVDAETGAQEKVAALLSLHSVFPPRLASDRRFVSLLTEQFDNLCRSGARKAFERITSAPPKASMPA